MIKHIVFMGHLEASYLEAELLKNNFMSGWESLTDVQLLDDRAFADFKPAYDLCRASATQTVAVAAHINLNGQNITIMAIQ